MSKSLKSTSSVLSLSTFIAGSAAENADIIQLELYAYRTEFETEHTAQTSSASAERAQKSKIAAIKRLTRQYTIC